MTRFFLFLYTCILILGSGCAPSTFLISKHGRAYYFGRESDRLYSMLCSSGDLEKILDETPLPERIKSDLYRYNCSEDRAEAKVISSVLFLTPEEKKALQRSFIRHDYTINYMPC